MISRTRIGIASILAGFLALALAGSALAWTAPTITPLCSTTSGAFRWTVTLSGTESSYDFQISSDGVNWSADIAGVQGDNLVVTDTATLFARWSADHSSMSGPVTNTVGMCVESSPSPSPSEITTGGGPSPSPSMTPEESASPSPSMSPEESESPGMSPSPSPSESEITTGGGPTPSPSESEITTGGGAPASASPTGQVLAITTTPPPTDTSVAGGGTSPVQTLALFLFAISAIAGGIGLLAPVRVKRR